MSNVFRQRLLELGIVSGQDLAQRMKSPAVIFFFGREPNVRAELVTWDSEGEISVSEHWPRYRNMTMAAMRRKTVEAAQKEAGERLGLGEWTRAPFDNCWLPTGVLEDARRKFMETPQSR